MTEYDITASAPILAAIDISKDRHEVLIEAPDKKRRRRVSVLNTLDEFDRLISLLRSYRRPVRVAFEATGNYHRALAHQLGSTGFEIKLISSIALARTREALHNSWDKNDPKDAQVILHMMTIGAEQFYHDPTPTNTPCQTLCKSSAAAIAGISDSSVRVQATNISIVSVGCSDSGSTKTSHHCGYVSLVAVGPAAR